ncbi:Sorbitol dehydrogenase [Nymphon striatum]|nr:Sorbitol dehydrogenase [Nymphon striatum]
MIDALQSGKLGWAGLDVFEGEPHVPQDLRDLPNTVLLPHVGTATVETRAAMGALTVDNLLQHLKDGTLGPRERPTRYWSVLKGIRWKVIQLGPVLHARIVDKNINRTVCGFKPVHRRSDGFMIGRVKRQLMYYRATLFQLGCCCCQFDGIAPVQDDFSTCTCQTARQGKSDPLRRTGDQGAHACQVKHLKRHDRIPLVVWRDYPYLGRTCIAETLLMSAPNQSIVIHAARDLRVEPRDVPAPAAGELIEMQAGGICGSDLHYYNHGGFGPIQLREPMVLGHEVSGVIAGLGDGVEGLTVGQLVARDAFPAYPRRISTKACRVGQSMHASRWVNGGASGDRRTFGCLFACGASGGRSGRQNCVDHRVWTNWVPEYSGSATCRCDAATDLSEYTLAMARQCGADEALNTATDPDALAIYQTDKGQIDVHLECSGAAMALAAGVACLRPRGTLVQLGLGGDMNVPMQAMTAKEITLRGSFRFHAEFATAVQMMQAGLIKVDPLITHSFDISQALEAFETASDRSRAMKVQLTF